MKAHRNMLLLLVIAVLSALSSGASAQSLAESGDAPSAVAAITSTSPSRINPPYTRPTERMKLRNYAFDSIGPYAIVRSAFAAGRAQDGNTPPEWKQGAEGYGKRFASAFGIAEVGVTTRYVLASVLKEDTLYYPCECKGAFPRLGHAALSTLIARRGEDGHRVFSVPALVAPYAGSMTAVYGWYPSRYDGRDAFRMGNYSLLEDVVTNVAKEFLFSGPNSLRTRFHRRHEKEAPIKASGL